MTPLHTAAASGDLPSLTTLLGTRRGLRLSRDELGRSALHLAASAGHLGAVRALLQAAAPKEKDATDAAGCTALHRAAADGHDAVVKVLIECGVLLDKQDQVHGNTALHEASWKGYSRTVAILASAGANLQLTNSGGFTALHLCCQNGHNQSCRELLLAGCDPDLQNNYGDTSLHTSARYGHAGVTRILISAQCHVSDQNKNGDTALHIAAAMGRRKLTRILLEAGCDRSLRNKQQETAKDIATRKGLAEICSLLESVKVKRGKKKKEKDKNDKSKKPKHKPWSPYGCHYYPDSTSFPKPRLDSLPADPLRKGEQYYLDLAGNIRKGPVGVGYTCYCAPLFQHMQQRLERDKQELKETIEKANERLGYKMAGLEHRTRGHLQQLTRSAAMDRVRCERRHRHLEQWLSRGVVGRHSERAPPTQPPDLAPGEGNSMNTLSRSKSLDQLLEEGRQVGLAKTVGSLDELEVEKDKHEEPRRTVAEIVASLQSPPSNHHPFIPRYTPDIQWSHQEQPTTSTCLPDDCVSESSEDEGVGVLPRSRSPVYSPGNTPGLTGIAGLTGLTGIAEQLTRVKLEDDSGYSTKVYGSSKGNSPMGDEKRVAGSLHEEPRRTVAEIVASLQSPPSNHHPFIPRYTPDIQWSHQEQPTTSTCLPDDCVSESSEDEGVGVLPRSRSPVYSPGNTPGLTGIAGLTGLTGIAEQLTRVKLEDDSGYSTKVYGSSKGNSPMGDEKRVAGSLV